MRPLLFLILSALLTGCATESIGDNATADGQEMMYRALTLLKEGNTEKADSLIGEYVCYYANAEISKKQSFCLASTESHWHKMLESGNPEWRAFLEKMQPLMQWYMESPQGLSTLTNFNKLRRLQEDTLADDI